MLSGISFRGSRLNWRLIRFQGEISSFHFKNPPLYLHQRSLAYIHTRIYIHMPSGNTPTIYIHGKKGGKLANVEDNDDTVPYLYTFPVARSRTRAIVILRLRVHVGVPFRACIIPTVVARRRWLMRQKSTDSSPTSSHTWPLTSAVISAVGLRRSLREPPCVLQFFCGRG